MGGFGLLASRSVLTTFQHGLFGPHSGGGIVVEIKEWNQSTGHVETLAVVRDDDAPEMVRALSDSSADHVVYASEVSE